MTSPWPSSGRGRSRCLGRKACLQVSTSKGVTDADAIGPSRPGDAEGAARPAINGLTPASSARRRNLPADALPVEPVPRNPSCGKEAAGKGECHKTGRLSRRGRVGLEDRLTPRCGPAARGSAHACTPAPWQGNELRPGLLHFRLPGTPSLRSALACLAR